MNGIAYSRQVNAGAFNALIDDPANHSTIGSLAMLSEMAR